MVRIVWRRGEGIEEQYPDDASHQIHANPELNFEEHFAHDLLTDLIERTGLQVERHAYGVDTAFESAVTDWELFRGFERL